MNYASRLATTLAAAAAITIGTACDSKTEAHGSAYDSRGTGPFQGTGSLTDSTSFSMYKYVEKQFFVTVGAHCFPKQVREVTSSSIHHYNANGRDSVSYDGGITFKGETSPVWFRNGLFHAAKGVCDDMRKDRAAKLANLQNEGGLDTVVSKP